MALTSSSSFPLQEAPLRGAIASGVSTSSRVNSRRPELHFRLRTPQQRIHCPCGDARPVDLHGRHRPSSGCGLPTSDGRRGRKPSGRPSTPRIICTTETITGLLQPCVRSMWTGMFVNVRTFTAARSHRAELVGTHETRIAPTGRAPYLPQVLCQNTPNRITCLESQELPKLCVRTTAHLHRD